MDKVYNIDEIFGSENVKVQAKLSDNRCTGCYFLEKRPSFLLQASLYKHMCGEGTTIYIYKNKR